MSRIVVGAVALALLAAVPLLAACGKKGPLYLPDSATAGSRSGANSAPAGVPVRKQR